MLTEIVNGVKKRCKDLTEEDISQILKTEEKTGKIKSITELLMRNEDLCAWREMDGKHEQNT
jgi:hypothetical protein